MLLACIGKQASIFSFYLSSPLLLIAFPVIATIASLSYKRLMLPSLLSVYLRQPNWADVCVQCERVRTERALACKTVFHLSLLSTHIIGLACVCPPKFTITNPKFEPDFFV